MRTTTWTVPAYHCHHCLRKIKETLNEIEGVRVVGSDPGQHQVTVAAPTPEALAYAKHLLAQAGYPVQAGNTAASHFR
jgi:copper chaperone CopZ